MLRFFDRFLDLMAILSGLLLALIPILIVYDAALRILHLGATVWVNDFSAIFVVYATFLAAPWLQREKGHIYVEVVADRLGGASRQVLAQAVRVVCALACLYLTYRSATVVEANIGYFDVSAIETPRWVRFLPLPFGFFLLMLQFIRELFERPTETGEPAPTGGV